jgi:hypothetical protein
LEEIGRVLRNDGALYIAVPDASTVTDRLYRFLGKGGGHVNPFTSDVELARLIERIVGCRHVATKTLCSSLSFLNRYNAKGQRPRRLLLFGGGYEWTLFLYIWFSRRWDSIFRTRTSVYGWAFYFGDVGDCLDIGIQGNVCIRCGSGHPMSALVPRRVWRIAPSFRVYVCPTCQAQNPFVSDDMLRHLSIGVTYSARS